MCQIADLPLLSVLQKAKSRANPQCLSLQGRPRSISGGMGKGLAPLALRFDRVSCVGMCHKQTLLKVNLGGSIQDSETNCPMGRCRPVTELLAAGLCS